MSSLAEKILEIRVAGKLSQEEFANKLGYSRSYVKDIETGRVEPSRNFLEKVHVVFGVSMDWLFSHSRVIDLIEDNKKTINPDLIFVFAFTQQGIEASEEALRNILKDRNTIIVDAQNKTVNQLFQMIAGIEGRIDKTWPEIKKMLLFQEVILILKNMSLSKIPRSGVVVRDLFKIIDDFFPELAKKHYPDLVNDDTSPNSSIIVLDYPSYLEKNIEGSFGYYAAPVYLFTSNSLKPK